MDIMDVIPDRKFVTTSIIRGVVWAFAYLYIRRGLNPDNKGEIEKYKKDAFYGGLAVTLTGFLTNILTALIVWLFGSPL